MGKGSEADPPKAALNLSVCEASLQVDLTVAAPHTEALLVDLTLVRGPITI